MVSKFQSKKVAFAIVTLVMSLFSALLPTLTRALDDGVDPVLAAQCPELAKHPESSSNFDLMDRCVDFFWHHGDYDPFGGQYIAIVHIGHRMLQINPRDAKTYTNIAWLEWSGYVTWLKNPAASPDGETRADSALALLQSGMKYLGNNVDYLKDSGDTMWPLASQYRKDFIPFVKSSYEKAFDLTQDFKIKVRTALNVGHIYRKDLADKENAILWYRTVLKFEPDNAVAHRYLKDLGAE